MKAYYIFLILYPLFSMTEIYVKLTLWNQTHKFMATEKLVRYRDKIQRR